MAVVINGTTGVTSVNGSASAPSVTGTDTDTGIVYGTNTLSLATGGTTAVTVDSSQNVGIGTNSPTAKLDVVGSQSVRQTTASDAVTTYGNTAASWNYGISSTGDLYAYTASAKNAIWYTTGAERMRIDSSGNVGIGIAPSFRLHSNSNSAGAATYSIVASNNAGGGGTNLAGFGFADGNAMKSSITAAIYGNDYMAFNVGGSGTTERMRIDASGNVNIGTTGGSGKFTIDYTAPATFTNAASDFVSMWRASGTNALGVAANTTGTTVRLVVNNGYQLAFNNGSSEAARIDSSGNLLLAVATQYYGTNQYGNKKFMTFNYPTTGFGSYSDCTDFYTPGNGNSSVQMRVTQAGNVGCRGTFSGGQTLNDYAEYFEWADGNPNSEDRTGKTVVLEGAQIRLATEQDSQADIIGAVSATAGVILGSSPFEWSGKYLQDDLGRQLTEEVTYINWEDNGSFFNYREDEVPEGVVVPENAERKTYKQPLINPDYNPDAEYHSRDSRKEWAAIGLMGQIRILKGQPIGDRWRKMRDISNTVEEWLVK